MGGAGPHGGELVTIELATAKQTVLRPTAPRTFYLVDGGWSPDGKSILYEKSTDTGYNSKYTEETTLELARRDGSKPRVLLRVTDPVANVRASWSPDGRRIGFYTQTGGPTSEHPAHLTERVGIIDLSDGRMQVLPGSGPDPPTWAPDSQRVAIIGGGNGDAITVFSTSGGVLQSYASPRSPTSLAWTKSGLYILAPSLSTTVYRSANGTDAPVRLFRVDKPQLLLDTIVPR